MRRFLFLYTFLLFIFSFSINSYADSIIKNDDFRKLQSEDRKTVIYIPQNYSIEGQVVIKGITDAKKLKIRIKHGDEILYHDVYINDKKFENEIWVSELGVYNISLWEHCYGITYKRVIDFNVKNIKKFDKFLIPSMYIESNNPAIIELAQELTQDLRTDMEKAKAIYDWITQNIEYDYIKALNINDKEIIQQYGALEALKNKKGICLDFSSLYSALARASGIPCKLIKGNLYVGSEKIYHAWNEAYVKEKDKWIMLDTTCGYIDEFKDTNIDNKIGIYEKVSEH